MSSKKNTMDAEVYYENVKLMLYKLAWKCHHTYGIPFDEAMSECHYAFVKAFNWRWNPNKGTKFSTTVQNIAQWRLKSLVIARAQQIPMYEIDEEVVGAAPPTRSATLEIMEDLSDDAQEIVQLIVDTPAEILGLAPVPINKLVKRIKEFLVKHKGRNIATLNEAVAEIKLVFREEWAV